MSATRTTLPVSATRPGAEKAFARICRKHLPPSLKRFATEVAEREVEGESGARAA